MAKTGRFSATQRAAAAMPSPTSPVRRVSRVMRAKKRSESVSPLTSDIASPELVLEPVQALDHAVVGEQPAVLLERMGVVAASGAPVEA